MNVTFRVESGSGREMWKSRGDLNESRRRQEQKMRPIRKMLRKKRKEAKCVSISKSIDLNYRRWMKQGMRGLLSTRRRWESPCRRIRRHRQRLRQTWDNNLGVIMHLTNAAAFKYQRRKPFMIHLLLFVLSRRNRRKLSGIALSSERAGEVGDEKFIRSH